MKKQFMFILAFVGIACIAQAQEYRTDISIRDQILNKQQPGAQYGQEATAKKAVEPRIPAYANMRVGQAIREGKAGGAPISTNVGNATAKKPAAFKTSSTLPSEMTAEEIKAVAEAAKQAVKTAAPVLPNQGDVKEPVSVPAEEPKKQPAEKQQ
jgi:hypothetical protein